MYSRKVIFLFKKKIKSIKLLKDLMNHKLAYIVTKDFFKKMDHVKIVEIIIKIVPFVMS